jgi:hypothetical protein
MMGIKSRSEYLSGWRGMLAAVVGAARAPLLTLCTTVLLRMDAADATAAAAPMSSQHDAPAPVDHVVYTVCGLHTGLQMRLVTSLFHELCLLDYLTADVIILDRLDQVAWRGVELTGAEGPTPREKHTLTALSGGRLLLFGGALRCGCASVC